MICNDGNCGHFHQRYGQYGLFEEDEQKYSSGMQTIDYMKQRLPLGMLRLVSIYFGSSPTGREWENLVFEFENTTFIMNSVFFV